MFLLLLFLFCFVFNPHVQYTVYSIFTAYFVSRCLCLFPSVHASWLCVYGHRFSSNRAPVVLGIHIQLVHKND